MVQIPSTRGNGFFPEIPPTGVGGLFRSLLRGEMVSSPKSHPRQWVDCSDPFYNGNGFLPESHPQQWVDCSDPF